MGPGSRTSVTIQPQQEPALVQIAFGQMSDFDLDPERLWTFLQKGGAVVRMVGIGVSRKTWDIKLQSLDGPPNRWTRMIWTVDWRTVDEAGVRRALGPWDDLPLPEPR